MTRGGAGQNFKVLSPASARPRWFSLSLHCCTVLRPLLIRSTNDTKNIDKRLYLAPVLPFVQTVFLLVHPSRLININ